ncbi:hypothetical protein BDA96_03G277800 [Sorghum bicolor]|uniref:Uncharacterized protein n=2 Tax=Sorghum bicolor TaxID=4558 RepID=A0A921REG5_SORBI|nr:hypothetical protein BDA96_03G277800 [Sorghum bicolor]OQU87331.1 hypothetical protein SORBI_3003G257050 [Sorghum bicolor]
MEVSQHSKHFCEFCGKIAHFAVKWKAVGIWGCKDWGKVKAGGGAHHEVCPLSEFFRLLKLHTASAVTVRSTIRRLREQTEA